MPQPWQVDADAFTEVVREHSAAVFGVLLRRVRDRRLAEDLAQETFLRAWQARRTYRGEATVRGWLCVIAVNVVRDNARKAGRRPAEVFDDDPVERAGGDDPASVVEAIDTAERLSEALDRLPDRHREMFLLRERDGLSYAEIARILGCPVGSVMSGLSRARARLLEVVVR